MKRVGFLLKVKTDKLEEYKQHHEAVWPEMLEALRRAGWHNYSLFMREDGDAAIELAIGTLDDPSAVGGFSRQSGVESRLPWFAALHALPEETTAGYRTPEDMKHLASLQHPDHDTETWP